MNGGITARSLPIDGNGGRQGNPAAGVLAGHSPGARCAFARWMMIDLHQPVMACRD